MKVRSLGFRLTAIAVLGVVAIAVIGWRQTTAVDEVAPATPSTSFVRSMEGTTPDGSLTLEPVFCLGLCACAPSAQMDQRLVGRADLAKLTRLVAEVGA